MTDTTDDPASTAVESILDHERFRDQRDVPFHEVTTLVDEAVVDAVAERPDLAAAGVTNDDGATLFRRLTDACSWKLPVTGVATDESFAAAIRGHVAETVGFALELDAVAGVWDVTFRSESGSRTATQGFVVFEATPRGGGDLAAATPEGDPVAEADWFRTVPDGADVIPGTELFVE